MEIYTCLKTLALKVWGSKNEALKNEGEDSDLQKMTIEHKIDVVTMYAKSNDIFIDIMFDEKIPNAHISQGSLEDWKHS